MYSLIIFIIKNNIYFLKNTLMYIIRIIISPPGHSCHYLFIVRHAHLWSSVNLNSTCCSVFYFLLTIIITYSLIHYIEFNLVYYLINFILLPQFICNNPFDISLVLIFVSTYTNRLYELNVTTANARYQL